jgi:uncharacterized protein (TIGR03066 family)
MPVPPQTEQARTGATNLTRGNLMRILLSCAIVLGLAVATSAGPQKKGDKGKAAAIDADLLVGKWETLPLKGVKGAKGLVREFTQEGKCYLGSTGKKDPRLEGTYKLDGDKLTVTISGGGGGPDEEHKYTVKKLTKTELVLVEGKLTETWKRAK